MFWVSGLVHTMADQHMCMGSPADLFVSLHSFRCIDSINSSLASPCIARLPLGTLTEVWQLCLLVLLLALDSRSYRALIASWQAKQQPIKVSNYTKLKGGLSYFFILMILSVSLVQIQVLVLCMSSYLWIWDRSSLDSGSHWSMKAEKARWWDESIHLRTIAP